MQEPEVRVLGVPIGRCDPLDLEVHPAGQDPGRGGAGQLPGYVRRGHDELLAAVVARAAAGQSVMAVLVGSSSTGKTRACWEAVQPLEALGWRLWHPVEPTRADAALAGVAAVGPRTVVWLNEAQHYLQVGEPLAAALHALLTDPGRAPVLVLGTLWPQHDHAYARRPEPGKADPYARVRELLAGRRIAVPDEFDQAALDQAARLAVGGDRLLAGVLGRAHGGRVAQHLAGAPELLRRYQGASAPAKALLHAAVDARRLGVGPHLPAGFLTDAAPGYLHPGDFDTLAENWAQAGLAELAEPVHGNLAPLRQARRLPRYRPYEVGTTRSGAAAAPLYRLADYLEQHGRHERWALCPPASFWRAAHNRLTDPGDMRRLGDAARARRRLEWADALYQRAAAIGDTSALTPLAEVRQEVGDKEGAVALLQRAADAGDTGALIALGRIREHRNDLQGAEAFYQRAADAGDTSALTPLAWLRAWVDDWEGAEALLQIASDAGDTGVLDPIVGMILEHARDPDTSNLMTLGGKLEMRGDLEGAKALYQKAADAGSIRALTALARVHELGGDREGAVALYERAADAEDTDALVAMALVQEKVGDWEGAEALFQRAAGDIGSLAEVAMFREKVGDRQGAEALVQRAADAGDTSALITLGRIREHHGDLEGAEALYRRAADAENPGALAHIALVREKSGDLEGAETLYRRAADAGGTSGLVEIERTRSSQSASSKAPLTQYGLDPDGTPSQPW